MDSNCNITALRNHHGKNNVSYTINCVVTMNTGLTATESRDFDVAWSDEMYIPNAEIIFDEFKKNIELNNIEKVERSMSSKTNLCLIGSAIFTLAIMVGVIGMLGATLSGI